MQQSRQSTYELEWSPLMRPAPDWFRDAKFGLFFHWGPYSVPACENEWYSRNMYADGLSQNRHHVAKYGKLSDFGYKDFYAGMTGERFDADAWAELVVRSGARYAGPVTEHADNFSLWNSKVNPINAVRYGPRRDIVGEFAEAIRKKGLRFIATFHHQWLWGWFMSTNPDADVYRPENEKYYGKALPLETKRYHPWRLPDDEFNRVWLEKVVEVIDAYDPDLIYFDSRTYIVAESVRRELLEHYYARPGAREDAIISYKQTDFPIGAGIVDLERGRFAELPDFVWQVDDRLEAGVTWCHVEGATYRPAGDVIRQLCDVVSKNGNLLLNVGPKADGSFPGEAQSVLREVGDWLGRFGEAIYGTRSFAVFGEGASNAADSQFDIGQIEEQTRTGTFDAEAGDGLSAGDIRFTVKGRVLYAIVMGRPASRALRIASLADGVGLGAKTIGRIALIGGSGSLAWERDGAALTVRLEGDWPSPHANVLRIEYV